MQPRFGHVAYTATWVWLEEGKKGHIVSTSLRWEQRGFSGSVLGCLVTGKGEKERWSVAGIEMGYVGSKWESGSWTGIQPMKASCIGAAGMTSGFGPSYQECL